MRKVSTRIHMLVVMIVAISLMITYNDSKYVYAQQIPQPTGKIVNSKYLTFKDFKFRTEPFSNSITGTVVNNSTNEVSSVEAYAELYDKDNRLITVDNGFADVMDLKPGDDSAFKISLFGLGSETVDHYTLLPGGSIR